MYSNLRYVIVCVLMVCCFGEANAQEQRNIPPIIAASDITDWTLAARGRDATLQSLAMNDAIFVVTGGAFSSDSIDPAARGQQAVALLDTAGVDVVNLSHSDMTGDATALIAAVNSAKSKIVSANISLPQGTPWKSHAIVERGGKRVAIIGVSTRSAAMDLRGSGAIAGVQVSEPRPAIEKVMVEIANNADAVVVIADAPLAEAAQWKKDLPRIDAVLISGRGGGSAATDDPRLARVPPGGSAVAVVTPADVRAVRLPSPEKASDAYRQVAMKFGMAPALVDLKVNPAAASAVPTQLPSGRLVPMRLTSSNRAAELTIDAAGLLDSFGSATAPKGKKFLILSVSYRNILSPATVRDQQVPVMYLIPKVSDHLYCVADENAVLKPATIDVPGLLTQGELQLPRAGSTESGKLIYEVDASAPPRQIVLRHYDFAHGHIVRPVLARPADDPAPALEPLSPPMKNEVVEIAVFDMKTSPKLGEREAPAGMQFVSLDGRARSMFTFPGDATAFDPKAKPGQKTQVGTVADWTDAHKYLQLVVDGEYGYAIDEATTIPPSPRFLPDVMTGGRVVFLAPVDAKSMELRCDFPNARLTTNVIIRPTGFTMPLKGIRPDSKDPGSVAALKDDFFDVQVVKQETATEFAGSKPDANEQFLVLDVTVNNSNESGEFFQPISQLKIATSNGAQEEMDSATFAGVHRPAEFVWIPPGERRSFQVAYRIANSERSPRLAYSGASMAKVIDLPMLEGQPDAVAAAPVEPAAPIAPAPPAPANQEQPVAAAPQTPQTPLERVDQARSQRNEKIKSARIPARPPQQPKGIAGFGLTPEQVNSAIDRGADFLWNHLKTKDIKKNYPLGYYDEHVLASLALVHAGAHKRMPDFDAQLRGFLASVKPHEVNAVYQLGLLCMLIEAYEDPSYLPQLRQATRYLLEAQGDRGTWTYSAQLPKELFAEPEQKTALRVAGGVPLEGPGSQQEVWKRLLDKGTDGDNSVSQFALLGLNSAARSGIRLPADIWEKNLAEVYNRQGDDGGWVYHTRGGNGYGSMTCAGICAVAINRHQLGAADPVADERIEHALGWLAEKFTVDENPGEDSWHYYYMYSLERVGRILNTEFIGPHEWYPIGARKLIGLQKEDGSWIGADSYEKDPRLATSFALLFLTRATPSLKVERHAGPGTLRTNVQLPPGQKLYIILDCSGSMLEEMNGRPKFEIAREAVVKLVEDLPPNAEVGLRLYGYRKRAIEEGASEDSNLIIPMAPLKKDEFLKILNGTRARGKTPLAYSLEQARADLNGGSEDDPITVLLLTDGGEDTIPRKDPVAAAAEYAKLKNVRLRIVGFDINREDWSKQLQAMAEKSGGQYLPAQQSDQLQREVRAAVFGTPDEYIVLNDQRQEVARGKFGTPAQLPQGKYTFVTSMAGRTVEEQFWINSGAVTAITFDAAMLGSAPPAENVPPAPQQTPAAATPKFCTSCGASLAAGAKFCTSCGAKVGG